METECEWYAPERWDVVYDTGCGETFKFIEPGIEENDFKFCPFCGRAIVKALTPDTTPQER